MARDTSELTDDQWEKIAPLFPAPYALPWGGPKPIPRPLCFVRDPVDFTDRSALEKPAQTLSFTQYVLAAATGLGRAGRVAQSLAGFSGPTRCPGPARLV